MQWKLKGFLDTNLADCLNRLDVNLPPVGTISSNKESRNIQTPSYNFFASISVEKIYISFSIYIRQSETDANFVQILFFFLSHSFLLGISPIKS